MAFDWAAKGYYQQWDCVGGHLAGTIRWRQELLEAL